MIISGFTNNVQKVKANPELEGGEYTLTGLEVDGEKYAVPGGGGGDSVIANPTVQHLNDIYPLRAIQINNQSYGIKTFEELDSLYDYSTYNDHTEEDYIETLIQSQLDITDQEKFVRAINGLTYDYPWGIIRDHYGNVFITIEEKGWTAAIFKATMISGNQYSFQLSYTYDSSHNTYTFYINDLHKITSVNDFLCVNMDPMYLGHAILLNDIDDQIIELINLINALPAAIGLNVCLTFDNSTPYIAYCYHRTNEYNYDEYVIELGEGNLIITPFGDDPDVFTVLGYRFNLQGNLSKGIVPLDSMYDHGFLCKTGELSLETDDNDLYHFIAELAIMQHPANFTLKDGNTTVEYQYNNGENSQYVITNELGTTYWSDPLVWNDDTEQWETFSYDPRWGDIDALQLYNYLTSGDYTNIKMQANSQIYEVKVSYEQLVDLGNDAILSYNFWSVWDYLQNQQYFYINHTDILENPLIDNLVNLANSYYNVPLVFTDNFDQTDWRISIDNYSKDDYDYSYSVAFLDRQGFIIFMNYDSTSGWLAGYDNESGNAPVHIQYVTCDLDEVFEQNTSNQKPSILQLPLSSNDPYDFIDGSFSGYFGFPITYTYGTHKEKGYAEGQIYRSNTDPQSEDYNVIMGYMNFYDSNYRQIGGGDIFYYDIYFVYFNVWLELSQDWGPDIYPEWEDAIMDPNITLNSNDWPSLWNAFWYSYYALSFSNTTIRSGWIQCNRGMIELQNPVVKDNQGNELNFENLNDKGIFLYSNPNTYNVYFEKEIIYDLTGSGGSGSSEIPAGGEKGQVLSVINTESNEQPIVPWEECNTIYFNTAMSTQEVDALLAEAFTHYIDDWNLIYVLLHDDDSLMIEKEEDNENTIYYIYDYNRGSNYYSSTNGWDPNLSNELITADVITEDYGYSDEQKAQIRTTMEILIPVIHKISGNKRVLGWADGIPAGGEDGQVLSIISKGSAKQPVSPWEDCNKVYFDITMSSQEVDALLTEAYSHYVDGWNAIIILNHDNDADLMIDRGYTEGTPFYSIIDYGTGNSFYQSDDGGWNPDFNGELIVSNVQPQSPSDYSPEEVEKINATIEALVPLMYKTDGSNKRELGWVDGIPAGGKKGQVLTVTNEGITQETVIPWEECSKVYFNTDLDKETINNILDTFWSKCDELGFGNSLPILDDGENRQLVVSRNLDGESTEYNIYDSNNEWDFYSSNTGWNPEEAVDFSNEHDTSWAVPIDTSRMTQEQKDTIATTLAILKPILYRLVGEGERIIGWTDGIPEGGKKNQVLSIINEGSSESATVVPWEECSKVYFDTSLNVKQANAIIEDAFTKADESKFGDIITLLFGNNTPATFYIERTWGESDVYYHIYYEDYDWSFYRSESGWNLDHLSEFVDGWDATWAAPSSAITEDNLPIYDILKPLIYKLISNGERTIGWVDHGDDYIHLASVPNYKEVKGRRIPLAEPDYIRSILSNQPIAVAQQINNAISNGEFPICVKDKYDNVFTTTDGQTWFGIMAATGNNFELYMENGAIQYVAPLTFYAVEHPIVNDISINTDIEEEEAIIRSVQNIPEVWYSINGSLPTIHNPVILYNEIINILDYYGLTEENTIEIEIVTENSNSYDAYYLGDKFILPLMYEDQGEYPSTFEININMFEWHDPIL